MPNQILMGSAALLVVGALTTGLWHSERQRANPSDDHSVYAPHAEGKPGAEVHQADDSRYYFDLFEERDITLQLQSAYQAGELTVDIETDEGIVLVSEQSHWTLSLTEPQKVALPVRIYGATEGRHHIHIFVTHTDSNGHIASRALANQVDVGVASLDVYAYKSNKAAMPSEVSMPAQETIY